MDTCPRGGRGMGWAGHRLEVGTRAGCPKWTGRGGRPTRRGGLLLGHRDVAGQDVDAVPVRWPHAQDVRLAYGQPGLPQGVYTRPRSKDRDVMRLTDPVRVCKSMRPEDCPTREHAPRGVREISSCRTASAGR